MEYEELNQAFLVFTRCVVPLRLCVARVISAAALETTSVSLCAFCQAHVGGRFDVDPAASCQGYLPPRVSPTPTLFFNDNVYTSHS